MSNSTDITEENADVTPLLSDATRITGFILMCIVIGIAFGLGVWVIWNRNSRTVRQMQPIFLIMLCAGAILEGLTVLPPFEGSRGSYDAYCVYTRWLDNMGSTITNSALFSKLWRVNQIFHAQGFHKKVVTVKDVLYPFLILFSLSLTFLIVLTTVDPPYWSTESGCTVEGWVGKTMIILLDLTHFVSLVILAVQAYRARDIDSEFSEARGVALALFSVVQSILIVYPTYYVMGNDSPEATYTLFVTQSFVVNCCMLFFIFFPIIMHHRQRERQGNSANTHITGLNVTSNASNPTARSVHTACMQLVPTRTTATTTTSLPTQQQMESSTEDGNQRQQQPTESDVDNGNTSPSQSKKNGFVSTDGEVDSSSPQAQIHPAAAPDAAEKSA